MPPRKPVSVLPVLRSAAFAAVLMAIAPAIHAQAPDASTPAEPSFNALLDTQTVVAINADPELRTMLGLSGDGLDSLSSRSPMSRCSSVR